MWVDGFNYRYFAGRKAEGGRETFASVIVSQNNQEITAQVTVAELGAIANKMVDAAAMAKGLGETGHIALYGIYFDTDKAVLRLESRPTLEQIAKLLTSQPQLNVFIVGHTDSQGAYDYNLDLSKRRADAIAAELVKSFRIAQTQLRTAGVGLLAPVGPNATDAGRALTGASSWWRREALIRASIVLPATRDESSCSATWNSFCARSESQPAQCVLKTMQLRSFGHTASNPNCIARATKMNKLLRASNQIW